MPYRVVQYQTKAEPIPLGAAERSTLDKWQSALPDNPVRRLSAFGALFSSLAFVPYVQAAVPTPVYVNSQSSEPIAVQHVQYQAKAEPVLVPAAPTETSTLDKWVVRIEQPRQDIKRDRIYPSFFAEYLHVAPTVSTLVYISGQSCEPISVAHFQYPSLTKPVFVPTAVLETITLDKWLSYWPNPTFKPKRLIQYGVNIAICESSDDGLPPLYWRQPVSQPLSRIRRLTDFFNGRLISPTFGESISLDKWVQETQRPRVDRRHQIFQSTPDARLFVAPGGEIVTLDKWFAPSVNLRIRRVGQILSIEPVLLAQAENVLLDKWAQSQNTPRWDIKRRQYVFLSLAIDTQFYLVPPLEIVRLDKWNRQYPDLIFRAKRLSDYGQFSLDPTLTVERHSIDKWFIEPARPQGLRVRFISLPDGLIFVPETVTLDKWISEFDLPRVPRRRFVQPLDGILFVPESVTPDKWLTEPVVPRSPQVRVIPLYELPLAEVTLVQILAQTDQPLLALRKAQQAGGVEPLTALEFKQWLELVQPFMPRDFERNQYFYALYTTGTDISLTLSRGIVVAVPSGVRILEIKPDDRVIIVPTNDRVIDV